MAIDARDTATLPDALLWAESHWDENRTAPVRLHDSHTTDGALGGLRYSRAMLGALSACPSDIVADERTANCGHPLLGSGSLKDCPECWGTGVKTIRTDRYHYPMWRALVGLQNALRPRRQPHPYSLILDLAEHGWDARVAARSRGIPWDLAEALYLRALRQLHGRYQAGPIASRRASWVDTSDSQRNAIVAGEQGAA